VDVGGTKIAVMVVAHDRRPLGLAQIATDVSSPERTLDCIVAAVEQALAKVPATLADVTAIGLRIPGRVRPACGLVESAVNLGWRQLRVGPMLEARFRVPCRLENDARAAALGAYQFGDERHFQNWAYVSVGTGIAAGLILDGELYRGPNGMAGEIGHLVVARDGPGCACGLRGCLETMAAGPAIVR
jgi:glucokinase